ncbi:MULTISPECIES: hypothetical protein [unclassified Streptomyces]|uniref:hypothetical protein n=1 Tax=unclassified Streptomyces TaxID=2593676 RepID=UPI00278BBF02|nr:MULTISPECIES: hypothetical protein [unclassified Streptomyces]
MRLTVHRSTSSTGRQKARIEQVADQAGEIVASRLGGRLGATQLVLTDGAGLAALGYRADLAVAGEARRSRRLRARVESQRGRTCLGLTVLNGSGTTVLVNGARHKGDLRELDATLLHELAHAVQLSQHAARDLKIRYLRMCFGADPDDRGLRTRYDSQLDIHEQQARNLEALARRLPAHPGKDQ